MQMGAVTPGRVRTDRRYSVGLTLLTPFGLESDGVISFSYLIAGGAVRTRFLDKFYSQLKYNTFPRECQPFFRVARKKF